MSKPVISNLCCHLDSRGRFFYRVDCGICTPLRYRCVFCYQGSRETKHSKRKCMTGQEHVPGIDGFGACCTVCGLPVFEEAVGDPTTCTLDKHVLAVYPFRCEACKGSVSFERPTICEQSRDGKHLLSSGFVDMGLSRPKVQPRDTRYDAEINGYLQQLRRSRLTRRFVSKVMR